MQSIRGLRRAAPSASPRRAILYFSRQSFASSICRSLGQSPDVERAAPQGINKDQLERKTNDGAGSAAEGVNGTPRTMSNLRNAAIPEDAAERSRDSAPDLCSSVTAAMAKLPHPAVVITTLDRTYHAQAAAGVPVEAMRHPIARGVTVSSFTSLCIRPRPHVMFNMTLPSTMYEALVACKDFNVHVLTPDEYGARVATVFTRGNRLPPPPVGESDNPKYAFDIDADLGVFVGLKDETLRDVEITNRDVWHEQYQGAKESGLRGPTSRNSDVVAQNPEAGERVKQLHHVPCLHFRGIIEVLHCRLARAIHPELPNAGQNIVIIGEVVGVTQPRKCKEGLDRPPIALGYADRKYRSISDAIRPHE